MLAKTMIGVWVFFAVVGPVTLLVTAAAELELTPISATEASTVQGDTPALLREANAWYAQRETLGAVERAIALYVKILSRNPQHYEALWRLARSYWWQGDHAPENQAELFDVGKKIAERAILASPRSVEGHFWYGVCVGRAGEVRGILNSLLSVEAVRRSMEAALKIDPHYHGALHVLGVLYRKVPGWPLSIGNMDKSLHYARLAVQSGPHEVLPHIGLAETLLAKGQKGEAIKILEEALTLTGAPDQQPETKADKQTAGRLLQRLR